MMKKLTNWFLLILTLVLGFTSCEENENFEQCPEIKINVEKALEEIRPFLQSDGGNISLVSIDDDKSVKVRLEGACIDCSVNQMTLKSGVEMMIKKYVPQIEEVINIS